VRVARTIFIFRYQQARVHGQCRRCAGYADDPSDEDRGPRTANRGPNSAVTGQRGQDKRLWAGHTMNIVVRVHLAEARLYNNVVQQSCLDPPQRHTASQARRDLAANPIQQLVTNEPTSLLPLCTLPLPIISELAHT
jgi:hypothetical protein